MDIYENIKNLIHQKKEDIEDTTLTYFTNYFYVVCKKEVNPSSIELTSLIDNALLYAQKIEFYDENHPIYKKFGGEVKGFRDPVTKTIFVRDTLEEPLKEITVYHELHHAVQTNPENDMVGINQESNIGRLIMEAQTQYFAESVYEEIHGITFPERVIPSENLRMVGNGLIVSPLHNYEMYDQLLSKLAIILEVPKEYFVSINYLYKNQEGLLDLEKKYNVAVEQKNLPYSFQKLLLVYDYIYCTDYIAYVQNENKDALLSGGETKDFYEIHPHQCMRLSLQTQRQYLNDFDITFFLALLESSENYKDFAHYIVDIEKRAITESFIQNEIVENPENKF